jgi:hypothetical protein
MMHDEEEEESSGLFSLQYCSDIGQGATKLLCGREQLSCCVAGSNLQS